MLRHDRLGNRQAETGAIGTAGNHREKDSVLHFSRDARAVIQHINTAYETVLALSDGKTALYPRSQGNTGIRRVIFMQRLYRVAHNVEQRLQQLAADAFKNVVASISTAVGNSFNALKSLETSRASFEVLTGSAEKASTTISGLAKFASTTPFEFPELAKAAKTLLGFGVSADEVQNRIRQIGDVSAATGGDLSGIATVVGQIFAAGKVNGQDYLQLINNSVALGPEIAKELGIPLSGVKDAIEKGAVTSDVFARALSGATSEGGKFFGGTGKLADTLDGRISTLKDTFTGLVGSIVGVDLGLPAPGRAPPVLGLLPPLLPFMPAIFDDSF